MPAQDKHTACMQSTQCARPCPTQQEVCRFESSSPATVSLSPSNAEPGSHSHVRQDSAPRPPEVAEEVLAESQSAVNGGCPCSLSGACHFQVLRWSKRPTWALMVPRKTAKLSGLSAVSGLVS